MKLWTEKELLVRDLRIVSRFSFYSGVLSIILFMVNGSIVILHPIFACEMIVASPFFYLMSKAAEKRK